MFEHLEPQRATIKWSNLSEPHMIANLLNTYEAVLLQIRAEEWFFSGKYFKDPFLCSSSWKQAIMKFKKRESKRITR